MNPAVLLLALSLSASSEQGADSLRASRVTALRQTAVAPPSDTVRMFRLRTGGDLADALRGLGALMVKDFGGIGGLKTVNVRSLGSAHTGVFLDGIAVEDAQNMQVDFGRFSTDDLRAVEVYNGQKSGRLMSAKEYGSASAVYLETARPARNRTVLRIRGGSFGTVNPSFTREQMLGGKTALRLSASALRSSGKYRFHVSRYLEGEDGLLRGYDTVMVRQNGDVSRVQAEGQLFGSVRGGDWQVLGSFQSLERGFPGPVVRRPSVFPLSAERQEDRSGFVQGLFRTSVSDRYAIALRGKAEDSRTHYSTHPELNPAALPYDNRYHQQSAYLSAAHLLSVGERLSFHLATDLQYNRLKADILQFADPSRLTFFGAGGADLDLGKLRLSGSLLYTAAYDRFRKQAGGFSLENSFRDAWTPSLILCLEPLEGTVLTAFAKHSCRLPSFNDLYYTLVGNSRLRPEDALQFGAGIRSSVALGSGWTLGGRAEGFANRVTDKIIAVPTANQFRWTMYNLGKVGILGSDLVFDLRREGPVEAGLSARYTFQKALDRSNPGSLTYGNQIPYIPVHSGSLTLDLKWKGLTAESVTVLTGKRYSSSANIPDYAVDPWMTTDLRLACTFPLRKERVLTLRMNLNNLLGRQYEIVQGYPMPGFNVMGSAEFAF